MGEVMVHCVLLFNGCLYDEGPRSQEDWAAIIKHAAVHEIHTITVRHPSPPVKETLLEIEAQSRR